MEVGKTSWIIFRTRTLREFRYVDLVTMTVQGCLNGRLHAWIDRGRATQISAAFLGQTFGQVAGPAVAVHCLAARAQAKAFLGAFVRFDFVAHGRSDRLSGL